MSYFKHVLLTSDDILEVCQEFDVKYTDKKLQILRENKLLQ